MRREEKSRADRNSQEGERDGEKRGVCDGETERWRVVCGGGWCVMEGGV